MEYLVVRCVGRREQFLSKMNAVIPWGELLVVLKPYLSEEWECRSPAC